MNHTFSALGFGPISSIADGSDSALSREKSMILSQSPLRPPL